MSSSDRDKSSFMDGLLRQGIRKEEIEKLYQSLREKGYGEEEARRRSRAALEKLRAQREADRRQRTTERPDGSGGDTKPASRDSTRKGAGTPSRRSGATAPPSTAPRGTAAQNPRDAAARRATDGLPAIPVWLRRRINRYAYAKGFLITRFPERFDDFMTRFDRTRGDFANRAFIPLLCEQRGYEGRNPFQLSFIDSIDALRDSARRFLGRTTGPARLGGKAQGQPEEVVRSLRAREPFAAEFFSVFTEEHDLLHRSLEFLSGNQGNRVLVDDLARVAREGYRLILRTEGVERERLEVLFDVVREVNMAHQPGERTRQELAQAEIVFRAAFQNLRKYRHELYPAVLKMIASFYEEEDESAEKRARILGYTGLKEEEILTWDGWQKRLRELRDKAEKERRERELARLEQEKSEQFSFRFAGTLATMASLFPESGVERMEQGEFVLPYFANRIFTRTASLQRRLSDLERLPSSDALAVVIVLHTILDDDLASVEPYGVEKLLGREGLASSFVSLRDSWHEAYLRLFEPYLDAIRDYGRELAGDPRYAKVFRDSQRARGIEERVNRLRNRALRGFGHVVADREMDAPKLFELSSALCGLLSEVGQVINQAALTAEDPVRQKIAEDLKAPQVVDFIARSQVGSPEFRPVTRQIRRWLEARFRESVIDILPKAQVAFLELFRSVAELYDYVLNDPGSFAAHASHSVGVASDADREVWRRERSARGRDSFQSLQATVGEEFPGQFLDALTGLKNKDYFLNEMPRRLEKLRAQGKPLTLLMIDIDHFKWVNDKLGHPRGDDVLKATAGMILDNVREGDLAVRFGGEEMLVLLPSDLHTGIILSERLRYAQESRIKEWETLQDVRKVGEEGGQPCATLSIGVADVTGIPELAKAVERADRALYAAKRSRNAVVFFDLAKEKRGGEPFSTYAEYRTRARASA
jgi:diguanylate cyclase (GGDEF)-like protein